MLPALSMLPNVGALGTYAHLMWKWPLDAGANDRPGLPRPVVPGAQAAETHDTPHDCPATGEMSRTFLGPRQRVAYPWLVAETLEECTAISHPSKVGAGLLAQPKGPHQTWDGTMSLPHLGAPVLCVLSQHLMGIAAPKGSARPGRPY